MKYKYLENIQTLWVIEAKMNEGSDKECWVPASFFKHLPFAFDSIREAQKGIKSILSEYYLHWNKDEFRISKYVFAYDYKYKDYRRNSLKEKIVNRRTT